MKTYGYQTRYPHFGGGIFVSGADRWGPPKKLTLPMSVGIATIDTYKERQLMIIIANENGDWWSVDETMITNLYVLDTDKITDRDALLEIADWAGIELEEDSKGEYIIPPNIDELINEQLPHSDKLERMAWAFGQIKAVKL